MKSFPLLLSWIAGTQAWSTFVVPHSGVAGQDDTPGLRAALANFSSDATILFEKGATYNILTPITFPVLNNVEIRIEGNLTLPDDIPTVQAIVADSSFPGAWFTWAGGKNVTLRGSKDPKWGWVDAHGQAWWDAQNQVNRPHGWRFSKIDGGVITDMKIWKPVAWSFSTSGSNNLHVYNNRILAVSDTDSFPFNTDGNSFHGVNFTNLDPLSQDSPLEAVICFSRAITLRTETTVSQLVLAQRTSISGGHGLSIGSLGKGGAVADVQNVLIENVVMVDSLYGARFKSWTGGNGLARK
ncbi:hypothetical protein PQX77_009091 [Marasmius sp. AFHP31]|nr:hypothetical protein PQX77_009091 [Marasmius sp. AFHP31]